MSDLIARRAPGKLSPGIRTENFAAFFEVFGRWSRERFLETFDMPFLMTQANTDPLTWSRARIVPVVKRSSSGKISIVADGAPLDDPAALLHSHQLLVGRDPSCDVVLPSRSVSKRHAYLTKRDLSWWVTDLRSSNGTTLDGGEIAPARPTRIVRSPARVSFGPDTPLMFLLPETLWDFLAQIRRVHGIEEPPAQRDAGPAASAEDFAALAEFPHSEDEAFSRVITLSRGRQEAGAKTKTPAPLPTPVPTGSTMVDSARRGDDERFADLLSAIDLVGDLVGRIEVELDDAPPLELFRGGTPAQLRSARERLVALRPRIARVRVTPSLGERLPYDIYVRGPRPGRPTS